jgi:NAD(P)-dependent dehydrogenase (short-subunit alcohol dehydrogenase family)
MTVTSKFGYHATALEVVDGINLTGHYAFVTGGGSGIGVETVRALAVAGAHVTVGLRNSRQGESLLTTLGEEVAARVSCLPLDLADLESVRATSEGYVKSGLPLHILVNNAGVMATPQGVTQQGFELQFGTNHLGHFQLTQGLLPALRLSGGARVVALSSSAHRRSDVVLEDPNFLKRPYDKWASYGQSKTANALFAVELTKRYAGDGIYANAVMPGGIMTGLQKHMPLEEQRAAGFTDEDGNPNPMFKSVEQGASTSTWAATGTELRNIGGLYLENCQEAGPMDLAMPFMGVMPYALDPSHATDVWEMTERLLGA